jgi:hypothetical protein
MAKPPPPYSILNPETNSDAPSAKSKGVRFVSATQLTSQTKTMGANIQTPIVPEEHSFRLKDTPTLTILKITTASLIS